MQLLRSTTFEKATAELCAQRLLDALPPVMRFVRKHMRSHRGKGLSVPQFRALVMLRSMPDADLSAVAEFLGASLPTASRIVSCLVKKGFVTRRESSSDRRRVRLVLTALGERVLERARGATQEQLARILEPLGPQDKSALLRATDLLESTFSPPAVALARS